MTSFLGGMPTASEGHPDQPTGDNCPYCLTVLSGESRRCGTCGASHHFDCWRENDGCATLGCDGSHRAPVDAEEPAAAPGPWPTAPPQPAPFGAVPPIPPVPAAPSPFAAFGSRLLDALRSGWKAAVVPAAGLYLGLVVLAFIVAGAMALFTGARFGDFSFLTVVKAAGLGIAMAFRGALRFETNGEPAFSVVAAPLGLLVLALSGVWLAARRAGSRHPAAYAWPLGLRFALSFSAFAGLGALAARTSEQVFSSTDFTLRATVIRTLVGTLLFTFPVATLAILSAQGRLAAQRQKLATRLGSWARPMAAAAALGGAQLVAALAVTTVWGLWELARTDLSMSQRLGVAVFGLLYLPTLALWGLGLASGTSLEMHALGHADKLGWFTGDRPSFIWLVGGAAALAMAVRAGLWLARRSQSSSKAWVVQFAVALSAVWLAGAALARATIMFGSDTSASGSLGLVLVQAALTGLAVGLVAAGIALLLVGRRGVVDGSATSPRDIAAVAGLWTAAQRNSKRVLAGFGVLAVLLGGMAGAVKLLSRPPGPFTLQGTVTVSGDHVDSDDAMDNLRAAYRTAHPGEAASVPSSEPTAPSQPTEPTDDTFYLSKPTPPTKGTNYYDKPTKADYTFGTYFSQEGYDYAMKLYSDEEQQINDEYAQEMQQYRSDLAEYNQAVGGYNARVAAYKQAVATYDADYAKYQADAAAWSAYTQKVRQAAQGGLTGACPSLRSSYYSIHNGADVKIADGDSVALTSTELRNGLVHISPSGEVFCTFDFGVEVPYKRDYRIAVGGQDATQINVADVKGKNKKADISLD
jgi:hypothetical protein